MAKKTAPKKLDCRFCRDGTPATCRVAVFEGDEDPKAYCDPCAKAFKQVLQENQVGFKGAELTNAELVPDPCSELRSEVLKLLGGASSPSPLLRAAMALGAPGRAPTPRQQPVIAPPKPEAKSDRPDPSGLLGLLGL